MYSNFLKGCLKKEEQNKKPKCFGFIIILQWLCRPDPTCSLVEFTLTSFYLLHAIFKAEIAQDLSFDFRAIVWKIPQWQKMLAARMEK